MAAPHVSGLLAAFLSVRREFRGRPDEVKRVLLNTCTDLERDRYHQGQRHTEPDADAPGRVIDRLAAWRSRDASRGTAWSTRPPARSRSRGIERHAEAFGFSIR